MPALIGAAIWKACPLVPPAQPAAGHTLHGTIRSPFSMMSPPITIMHQPSPALFLFRWDLASGQIGRYNFITPNLTNDMHSPAPGSTSLVRQGDTWLAQELPAILNSSAFSNNGAVFLTFDEEGGGGPIMMMVLSPLAKGGGYASSTFYDHASTLRTMQDIFGVGPYLGDTVNATNLGELFLNLKLTVTRTDGITRVLLSDVPVGKINYLQASSDLAHWTTINSIVADAPNEMLSISDPDHSNQPQRFYRVVEAP